MIQNQKNEFMKTVNYLLTNRVLSDDDKISFQKTERLFDDLINHINKSYKYIS